MRCRAWARPTSRTPLRFVVVEDPAELQHLSHWRLAVWSLRVGYVGLAIAVVGAIVLASGSTAWLLAAGIILWLATVVVTLTGFLRARHELAEPRPTLWSMRMMLVRDTVRARPSD
jgi:hypothetical protein